MAGASMKTHAVPPDTPVQTQHENTAAANRDFCICPGPNVAVPSETIGGSIEQCNYTVVLTTVCRKLIIKNNTGTEERSRIKSCIYAIFMHRGSDDFI